MVSDDTEHTCIVAQSLISAGLDIDAFTRDFARRLRWWFASLPAGIGRATLRSCVKLWFGASPKSSGVFSAGNGPAMRSAIFGASFDDLDAMVDFVRVSARITHSDPKAEYGAIAIALAAFLARRETEIDGHSFIDQLEGIVGSDGDELVSLLREVVRSVSAAESTLAFAANSGLALGVTGYTYHTVPVVIHAWLCNPRDYRAAVTSVIECGGDADTTAAIVGGIVGTATGESGIPDEWISSVCEWPRSIRWMHRLACQLSESLNDSKPQKPLTLNFVAVLLRNIIFLVVVLVHGFRRLLPPY
jgi:ADP-ribosylglycohydrolase